MLFAPQIILTVVALVIAYVLLFVGELAAMKALGVRIHGSVLAFFLGFILATFFCMVLYVAIVFTGAVNYLTGAMAENWTKKEFAALGSAWRVFPNVPFSVGFGDRAYVIDVDHIVVGPYGVLVLETKFSSSPLDLDRVELELRVSEAVVQVEDNAGRVRALLRKIDVDVPIRPVIIFWGRMVKSPEFAIRRIEGRDEDVRILHGRDAKEWRSRLREKQFLSSESAQQVSARIESYVSGIQRQSKD